MFSEVSSQHQLRGRLQPQAQLFVGIEYDQRSYDQNSDFIQDLNQIVAQEFGAFFPGATFHSSDLFLHPQEWFRASNRLAPQSDYMVVLRLVNMTSSNVLRSEECSSDKLKSYSAIQAFSEVHPFGPDHHAVSSSDQSDALGASSKGVIHTEASALDQLITQFNLGEEPISGEQRVQVSQMAKEPETVKEPEKQTEQSHSPLQALSPEVILLQEMPEQAVDIDAEHHAQKDPKPVQQPVQRQGEQQAHSHDGIETISVEQESCGLRLASGRDELRMVASLYAQNQRMLLDHARLETRAGLAGWQADMSSQMLRVQVKRLAGRYAGQAAD